MGGREFDIIDRYFSGFAGSEGGHVTLGPGDDCAILDVPVGRQLCVSTDTFLSGVHFPVSAPAGAVAHRSLAASLSDLAAMGSECFAFTLALTMPDEDDRWLEEFSATLGSLVSRYRIPLVGGNLARGSLSITMTVMGTLPSGKGLRRSGAQVGDDIYVSGTLGDAAGGLAMIAAGEELDTHLGERYYYPRPRLALGSALLDLASAAIDISDGLAADLGHVCASSGVGAKIDVNSIPLSQPLLKRFAADRALALAIGAGDDYELCFSAPVSQRDAVQRAADTSETPITRIGTITAGESPLFLDGSGKSIEPGDPGYQHFHDA